jgi:SsrA-binding protein
MPEQIVVKNKKAFHDYEIINRYEAGIVLYGSEVKAIREGRISLVDSYAQINNHELWLKNCHISLYSHGGTLQHAPMRIRKLLLHRREINKLIGKTIKTNLTIVPLSIYFKDGKIKVAIALARGKRLYDKREQARRKTIQREMEMEIKRF